MTGSSTSRWILGCLVLLLAGTVWADSGVKSGYEYIKEETRQMQDDEFENPGYLAVDRGQELFRRQPDAGKSCASCHGEDGERLEPKKIARYPVYDQGLGGIVRLQDRIRNCQEQKAGTGALPYHHPDLLALETFVRHLAFGEPVNVQTDGEMAPLLKKGEAIYHTRFGLIDMSCAHCHEMYPGQYIRGQRISQGMGNGFPAYRLDTGEMANLDLRIKQCLTLMRAEPFAPDAEESRLLGAYIMSRSNGLRIETPAVRY